MAVDRRMVLGALAATIVPLKRPANAQGGHAPGGPVVLEAGPGRLRLLGTADTAVWAYNGQVPGPLLRVALGQEVAVRLNNKLGQPTTLCWHGVRIANAMDGVAGLTQEPVPPGGTFDYRFTPPDSGLYWYHPHIWPATAEQIGRGLYGVLIVDEAVLPSVDEDLLVVLDDWALDDRGQIKGDFLAPAAACGAGRIGSLMTVSSKPVPDRHVLAPGARVRLRLLNACAARIAMVGLDGVQPTVIAVDGQPSEMFLPARGTVPIGPGSRFELLFDLPTGSAPPPSLMLRREDGPDEALLHFAVAGKAIAPRTAPFKLADNPRLPTRIHLEKSLKKDLVVTGGGSPPAVVVPGPGAPNAAKVVPKHAARGAASGAKTPPVEAAEPGAVSRGALWCWTLDGRASDGNSGRPMFTVRQGEPVTLAFVNRTAFAQQMHVHGHVFRVLHDLDDGWDPYWRDSVLVAPNRTKHVAFVADNPGRWVIESLIRDRQVTGLAGFFIVEPMRSSRR